ncbi:hypothetical protein KQX54_003250 [Cotesia glomerata]|uniref:Uncharacterized protein n=1 Tax=Cotesia glomerata TaxID=32391 RepID=A0AAV7ISH4_COTGL|nr:hypothetical protein KQX54_003250 [Cotesia glomerata]
MQLTSALIEPRIRDRKGCSKEPTGCDVAIGMGFNSTPFHTLPLGATLLWTAFSGGLQPLKRNLIDVFMCRFTNSRSYVFIGRHQGHVPSRSQEVVEGMRNEGGKVEEAI